ncbi:MAG: septum formation initiator family protein [Proteobacteria bacterium]|nr:septum formation initiator family protein [Pseudomonadota bacterium]MBU1687748.1 septum formation initiator family protein [Pseudomonadota bacterium]
MLNISTAPGNTQKAIGIIVLLSLLGWLLFSPWGYLKFRQIRQELTAQHRTNRELIEENRALRTAIERLQNDPAYIREIARKEHGLIKKNEMIFPFPEKKGKAPKE